MNLNQVVDAAISKLNDRQEYAKDVIRGRQLWSGADLKGKAKTYSKSYEKQRGKAYAALKESGGVTVQVDNGKIVTAIYAGQDEFGDAIYHTTNGVAVTNKKYCKILS